MENLIFVTFFYKNKTKDYVHERKNFSTCASMFFSPHHWLLSDSFSIILQTFYEVFPRGRGGQKSACHSTYMVCEGNRLFWYLPVGSHCYKLSPHLNSPLRKMKNQMLCVVHAGLSLPVSRPKNRLQRKLSLTSSVYAAPPSPNCMWML